MKMKPGLLIILGMVLVGLALGTCDSSSGGGDKYDAHSNAEPWDTTHEPFLSDLLNKPVTLGMLPQETFTASQRQALIDHLHEDHGPNCRYGRSESQMKNLLNFMPLSNAQIRSIMNTAKSRGYIVFAYDQDDGETNLIIIVKK